VTVNHITYQLSPEALGYSCLDELMELIGFEEIEPGESVPEGWSIRWFADKERGDHNCIAPVLHFVACRIRWTYRYDSVALGLGHFCVRVGTRYEECRRSDYCVRDSGSGRVWLEYDNKRLRIEVRP
jgi:hypothetical protein